MRADLHTHSTVSDGTDAPAELMRRAREAGLDAVALTDHDTFDGHAEARAAAAELGLAFIGGMEMSTEVNGHSVHLLMYGGRADDPALGAELARVRQARLDRLPAMLRKLAGLGMPLAASDVATFADDASSLGRPHVADALVAAGYVADRDEAFARWLGDDKPAYVDRYATPLERAIGLIRGAAGVAVVAHPWSRGRRHDLPESYLTRLVTEHGLDGFECDHPDHLPAERATLHALAAQLGVLATGSSDHHGAGKKAGYALGACTTASDQFERLGRLIAERASSSST